MGPPLRSDLLDLDVLLANASPAKKVIPLFLRTNHVFLMYIVLGPNRWFLVTSRDTTTTLSY